MCLCNIVHSTLVIVLACTNNKILAFSYDHVSGLKEHFTSEMLGLDIGNPELFNRHASSEHMVKVNFMSSCFLLSWLHCVARLPYVQDYTQTCCGVTAMNAVTNGDECKWRRSKFFFVLLY